MHDQFYEELNRYKELPMGDFLQQKEELTQSFQKMNDHAKQLQDKCSAQNYRTAEDFFVGVGLAARCQEFYNILVKKTDWLDTRWLVADTWVRYILSVASHYHHMVGPAMLAAAETEKAQGNPKRAHELYEAIAEDFRFLADDWASDDEAFSPSEGDEDYLALKNLQEAILKLLKANDQLSAQKTTEYEQIKQQLDLIFSRPTLD